jgi:hypothetical protein
LNCQVIRERDDSLEKVKQAEEKAQEVWVLTKYSNFVCIMWLKKNWTPWSESASELFTFLNYVMDIRTVLCKGLILLEIMVSGICLWL